MNVLLPDAESIRPPDRDGLVVVALFVLVVLLCLGIRGCL